MWGCTADPSEDSQVAVTRAVEQATVKGQVALKPTYVGSAICAECHSEQFTAWSGSHHDKAMQMATAETVLGDFTAEPLVAVGRTTKFAARDGGFFVTTDGEDSQVAEFEVKFTFGVEPLQQYLVELADGRLQALSSAWDSRPAADGGQRWFSLDTPTPEGHAVAEGSLDVLHWTGAGYRWNSACADCHSTNVRKGYNAEGGSYQTTWSDVNVGCEACHGAGSRHVATVATSDDPSSGFERPLTQAALGWPSVWIPGQPGVAPHRREAPNSQVEFDTCAACHSRRQVIAEADPQATYLDLHRPVLLDEGLYFADGQMLDEVFVYGSFLQSKMHAAGVTCSDCHDAHSLELKATGDQVCSQCHTATVYQSGAHHHHEVGSEGASCVNCHMPSRTYMEVDARRDHSFRIPRPDLSVKLDQPNACNACHSDQSAAWAAQDLAAWGGDAAPSGSFAMVFDQARRGDPRAGPALRALAAASKESVIVRATALQLLAGYGDQDTVAALMSAVASPQPLLRWGATLGAVSLPLPAQVDLLVPLLRDPVRLVRIEAARNLAPAAAQLQKGDRAAFDHALEELRAGELLSSDDPAAQVNLGVLESALGNASAARERFRAALQLADYFIPAYLALSEISRAQGLDDEADLVLSRGLERLPGNADLLHARGLARVRARRPEEAIEDLHAATLAAPDNVRFAYVYGVGLHSTGQIMQAMKVLEAALLMEPRSVEILTALASMNRDLGRKDRAIAYTDRLAELLPDDPAVKRLRVQLQLLP